MLALFFPTWFPPPNSHLKPPGRCPVSASHFSKKIASHHSGRNNFCTSAPQPPRSVNLHFHKSGRFVRIRFARMVSAKEMVSLVPTSLGSASQKKRVPRIGSPHEECQGGILSGGFSESFCRSSRGNTIRSNNTCKSERKMAL